VIRVVNFRKAVLAGVAAAAVMEAFSIATTQAGFSPTDLVSQLASVTGHQPTGAAWLIAFAVHLGIGVCWAIFYAFFFWGRSALPPALQGLVFAVVPSVLAALFVFPEIALMRLPSDTVALSLQGYLALLTAGGIARLLIGHALFGVTVGTIYQRPVGYPAGHKPAPPSRRRKVESAPRRNPNATGFMFATGIECSYPTIENGRWRRDEMESTRHYEEWQTDLRLAREIGITHIRYGPPLHLIFNGPGRYDWDFIDPQMAELAEFGPEPIIDLCHFGVPAWLGNLQNSDIGRALAEYAGAFAERFPWVRFYTPVNEMYVCARMSALDGLWNEQLRDEGAYARAAWNLADASIRMSDAILERRKDAILINSESSEFCQPCCPDPKIAKIAETANAFRFLPLDLIFAHPLTEDVHELLRSQGIEREQIETLGRRKVPPNSILGVDYYEWNERLIDSQGQPRALGEMFGWYVIAQQYWERYRRPIMHTETNKMDAEGAARWLWRQWHNVQLLAKSGVPLVGFTWYSLTDQIDWSLAMSDAVGLVYPVGLFDLNREPRTVGLAYKHLIDMFRDQPGYRECKPLAELMH
jgi:beta-glucosidase/6-phospho-beta-glucosidase/beta-galactosidase